MNLLTNNNLPLGNHQQSPKQPTVCTKAEPEGAAVYQSKWTVHSSLLKSHPRGNKPDVDRGVRSPGGPKQ